MLFALFFGYIPKFRQELSKHDEISCRALRSHDFKSNPYTQKNMIIQQVRIMTGLRFFNDVSKETTF